MAISNLSGTGAINDKLYNVRVRFTTRVSDKATNIWINLYSKREITTFSELYNFLYDNSYGTFNNYPVSGGGYTSDLRMYYIIGVFWANRNPDRIGLKGCYIQYENEAFTTSNNISFSVASTDTTIECFQVIK